MHLQEPVGTRAPGPLDAVLSATPLWVVAAHPDDETLGAAGLLLRRPDCTVLHVTDGAPRDPALWSPQAGGSREQYAKLRMKEALAALGLAGVSAERIHALGIADQEAPQYLAPLARQLARLFADHRPQAIVIQPYEGGHPDHDASAFAVHAAAALLRRFGRPAPLLVEMTSYHARSDQLVSGEFLRKDGVEERLELGPTGYRGKQLMLACYASQKRVIAQFPVRDEPYRFAPAYDFTRPPHSGKVYYERLGWTWTAERFCEAARAALEELKLGPPC